MNDLKNIAALKANKEDNFWRFINIFPCIINVIMLVIYITMINTDSIMHNINKNNDKEALVLIEKIYSCQDEDKHDIL